MTLFTQLLSTVCLVLACGYESELFLKQPQSKILSAYHGLDALPAGANVLCPIAVEGEDGMPVVFSVQIDSNSVMAEAFEVETASGEMVTPICATLAPALEMQEQRTVLLAGAFGTRNAPPLAVEVVGALEDLNGKSLQGERFTNITPGDHVSLEYGYSQYLSQRFEVGISGYSQWQVEQDERPMVTELGLDPNAKGEVHAFGVEAAYWFTPRFNMSLRYIKEYEGRARLQGEWIALNFIWTPVPVF